jgi:L-lactate utilization protein LutB
MQKPVENYWQIRLNCLKKTLEENNFEVFIAETQGDAKDIVFNEIIPLLIPKTVSWGSSMTLRDTGIRDALLGQTEISLLNPDDPKLSKEAVYELRRQALLVDLYFTGTNAVTEDGHLVYLYAIGNRVTALHFGPRNVVVITGRNKIVPGIEEAMIRIKNYVAPVNVMRLDRKTPCLTTSMCLDCKNPDRICNVWTITEKAFPKHRIKIILVNQDMGF